jgi:threonine/homoserine/homoserine lactone efflux protein
MILSLLTGIVIGVAVAIPPGPIMFVIVRGALHKGRAYALKIGYGIALLDIVYSFVFSLATGKISQAVMAFSAQYPQYITVFQLVCILGLILYGIISLRANLAPKRSNQAASTNSSTNTSTNSSSVTPSADDEARTLPVFMRTLAKHGPFFLGVALALTHLANPTFIPLMTSVSYVAGHYGFLHEGAIAEHIAFALGYASGVFAWLTFLVTVSVRYRHLFSDNLMVKINRVLGFTMIGVGTYWGWHRFEVILLTLRDVLKLSIAF